MQLSVIIVSFNTKELLANCLASLFASNKVEFKESTYEIIVVDNGSTDGSIEMAQKQYPEIKLILNEKNDGFGKANNRGVSLARGNYILFLNPDTIVQKNTLPYLINFLERTPTCAIATCAVFLQNGQLDDACHRGFPTPWRAVTHFAGLGRLFPHSIFFNGYHLGYQNMDKTHEIEACAGAFLLIRKTTGAKIGWFDEDYFWYGEDLDLCYRVKQAGYSVLFVPQVQITHYKGASSGMKKHSQHLSTIDMETKKKITRSRFEVMRIFYRKHYQNKYPQWLMQFVFLGINVKEESTKFFG